MLKLQYEVDGFRDYPPEGSRFVTLKPVEGVAENVKALSQDPGVGVIEVCVNGENAALFQPPAQPVRSEKEERDGVVLPKPPTKKFWVHIVPITE